MKIDLVAVGCCLQKPELAGRIEALHDSDRLALVVLDVSLHLADFILQLAARVFEGVVVISAKNATNTRDTMSFCDHPFSCCGPAFNRRSSKGLS